MRIAFHHANPERGNESFVLRFETIGDETPCLLIDAGNGVDLDALLRPSDRLVAICLTHAYLDHYAELTAAHRDDAPILTSPATAAVLADVFDVAARDYDVATSDAVAAAITPVDDWTTVAPDIEVHPVPAGHVPGGVGFLVRVTDGEETHQLLATGDFTCRRAGGYPGFDPEAFVDIDALFLTGATDDSYEESLTQALGTALEHAHSGARTLLATSGLVGVQCAYLLSALTDEYDLRVPIRVVGQVAKLYEALEYDCPGVETVPLFEEPSQCLDPGVITIAGPEIPHERSSGRLFGVLRDDPSACVVQLVGSGETPLTDGQCTMHDFALINHPTRETLDAVHDAIAPTETIIVHRHRGAKGAFNDLDSVVWGAGDTTEYTLFDGNQWRLPPWMNGGGVVRSNDRSVQEFAESDLLASFSLPTLERHDTPDLAAEGIDIERLASLLHQSPDAAGSRDVPTANGEPSGTATERLEPAAVNGVRNAEATQGDSDASRSSPPLVRTATPSLDDDPDPSISAALEEGRLTPTDLEAVIAMTEDEGDGDALDVPADDRPDAIEQSDESDGSVGSQGDSSSDPAASTTDEESPTAATTDEVSTTENGASDERSGSAHLAEQTGAEGASTEPEPMTTASNATEGALETSETAGQCDEPIERPASASPTGPGPDSRSRPGASKPAPTEGTRAAGASSLELNALAVALLSRAVQPGDDTEGSFESVDAAIVAAVERYVLALLAGEASGDEDEQFVVDLAASPAITAVLGEIVEEDERFESTSEFTASAIAATLEGDADATRDVRGLGTYERQIDAVVRNTEYAFSDREAVVEAAIAWFLAPQRG